METKWNGREEHLLELGFENDKDARERRLFEKKWEVEDSGEDAVGDGARDRFHDRPPHLWWLLLRGHWQRQRDNKGSRPSESPVHASMQGHLRAPPRAPIAYARCSERGIGITTFFCRPHMISRRCSSYPSLEVSGKLLKIIWPINRRWRHDGMGMAIGTGAMEAKWSF
jgi:hypothetical protein